MYWPVGMILFAEKEWKLPWQSWIKRPIFLLSNLFVTLAVIGRFLKLGLSPKEQKMIKEWRCTVKLKILIIRQSDGWDLKKLWFNPKVTSVLQPSGKSVPSRLPLILRHFSCLHVCNRKLTWFVNDRKLLFSNTVLIDLLLAKICLKVRICKKKISI